MTLASVLRVGAIFAIASFHAWAQVAAPPLLGLLPDHGNIRAVHGIPASASIAPALNFGSGSPFLQIAISPHQDFALVSAQDSGTVMIAYPPLTTQAGTTQAGTTQTLTGVSAHPDSIRLSPQGSAAILWFASTRMLEIVSGLPASPVVRQVNASFLSPGSSDLPASLTVSDDGSWGAGAWASGVWAFGPNGEVRNLLAGDRALSLSFFGGTQNLAAATATGLFSITDVGGSAASASMYTFDGRRTPLGIGISSDNRRIVMADNSGGILTLNVSSGVAARIDCGCAPDGVISMGGSLFRITGLTGSVFRLFDAAAGSVFLAPLAAAPEVGQ
jgi:hypothetical protein